MLTYYISTWYTSSSTVDRRVLQRVVIIIVQNIIGCSLASLERSSGPTASAGQLKNGGSSCPLSRHLCPSPRDFPGLSLLPEVSVHDWQQLLLNLSFSCGQLAEIWLSSREVDRTDKLFVSTYKKCSSNGTGGGDTTAQGNTTGWRVSTGGCSPMNSIMSAHYRPPQEFSTTNQGAQCSILPGLETLDNRGTSASELHQDTLD
ncbi:hypothetical protein AOLI_G00286940 [Acnodon oligacanthus]